MCIRNDSLAKQNISRVSCGKALPAKHSCHHPILTLHIPVMCRAHASLRKMLTHELPAKTLQSSICLESSRSLSLSLSYTTLTNKTHMKYRVQKIEYNYNQIWHEIKTNKTHGCKLQLYKTYSLFF